MAETHSRVNFSLCVSLMVPKPTTYKRNCNLFYKIMNQHIINCQLRKLHWQQFSRLALPNLSHSVLHTNQMGRSAMDLKATCPRSLCNVACVRFPPSFTSVFLSKPNSEKNSE